MDTPNISNILLVIAFLIRRSGSIELAEYYIIEVSVSSDYVLCHCSSKALSLIKSLLLHTWDI